MFRDNLRVDLPAATTNDEGNVDSRRYPLTIFCRTEARIIRLVLDSVNYTPVVAKPELWNATPGGEYGRYTGDAGFIPVTLETSDLQPFVLYLFNWSTDAGCSFNLVFTGYQFGEA